MTNSLSEDIYALGELMATNLVTQGVASADADDGLTTLAGKILDITASTTTLTIEVPLNLVYSDDFNITGTLTDGNDDAISGATVKLKVGNTVVDTDTTDNDGEVSFTQAPVSMGNHSFQLIFEGDSTHPAAISSVVTREIGKETTAITVSSPAASSSYYSDASISVSGTLKTDDNEAISGASVLVKLGATTLTTLTTDSNGAFSGSVSAGNLSSGSNTLKFEFAGDSYYSTTYQEVAVTVNAVSLALSSNKSILSYADSDSCTLTATYTGASVTGKTVKLYKASDDSEIATMTDNNDGTYTATYNSAGVGDIGFYAKVGTLVSETYSIEDCVIYKTAPINTTGTSSSDTVYSIGIDDLGYDLSDKNFDLDFTMKFTDKGEQFNIGAKSEWSTSPIKGNYRAYIGCTGGGKKAYGIRTTSTNGSEVGSANSFSTGTDHTCKISKSSDTFTYIVDGDTLGTKTENWWSSYSSFSFYIVQWNTGTTTIKDIKLKVL